MEKRENLKSRLGFILLSAGCAIGIGNVWKFPYVTGENGGGFFVLIYLFFLLAMGVPMMTMEFAIGRASRKSPYSACKILEKPGQKWHLHGYLAIAGNYLLMMFYTSVSGWMMHYFYLTASGQLDTTDKTIIDNAFTSMQSDPLTMVFWMILVIVIGFIVCSVGVQNGVERVTKVIMIALLFIIILLATNSLTLKGGISGLKFYLLPDFDKLKEVGIVSTVVAAMNQSFFTLSLGIGSMAIFGSYIDKKHTLFGESIRVAALDTFVAVFSGLIIFPACFSFGVKTDSGPDLIFKTLPNVFGNMPLGRLWGSMFFIFLAFAAFSTIIAVFENIISCYIDLTGVSRKKASYINILIMTVLSLPCALGFNILSEVKPFGTGSNIMDLEDFIVSNLLLPIGALIYLLFCTAKRGWGWKNFIKETNTGDGIKMPNWLRIYVSYILPIVIVIILVMGIYDKFCK